VLTIKNFSNYFALGLVCFFQYNVVYFAPDGEEVFQVRSQTDFSNVPDPELFQVPEPT
jgi:hypothetical protein